MADKKASILLAEDDVVLQEMYQERLQMEGFEVIVAGNGKDALTKINERHPNLIILDIMMPQVNGIDVLKQIKGNDTTKNIPIIIATALVQDMTELKQMLSPRDAYLVKSEVTPADIIKMVKAKLGEEAGAASAEATPPAAAAE